MTVPDDFAEALTANEAAATFFDGMNKPDRYSVLWRIETASVKARASRIQAMMELLTVGKCPGAEARAAGKAKKIAEKPKTVSTTARERKRQEDLGEADDYLVVQANPSKQSRREGLCRRPQEH